VLSGTHSPLRWWNPDFGLITPAERAEAVELIRTDPPPLVIMDTEGNELSDAVDPVVVAVTDRYRRLDTVLAELRGEADPADHRTEGTAS